MGNIRKKMCRCDVIADAMMATPSLTGDGPDHVDVPFEDIQVLGCEMNEIL